MFHRWIASTVLSFLFLSLSVSSYATPTQYSLLTEEEQRNVTSVRGLSKVKSLRVFNLNLEEVKRLLRENPTQIEIQLPYGLSLKKNPTFEGTRYETASGAKFKDSSHVYSGYVQSDPSTYVSLSVSEAGVFGYFHSIKNGAAVIEMHGQKAVYYKSSEMKGSNRNFECDTGFTLPSGISEDPPEGRSRATKNERLEVELAVDMDFDSFLLTGSTSYVAAYAKGVLAAVSTIFERDLNVQLKVNYLRVWDRPDPYWGNSTAQILKAVERHWNLHQTGIKRDLVHLLMVRKKSPLGGKGYIGGVCSKTRGFGMTAMNGKKKKLPEYSWDVAVVAHELGHNLGSYHTHNCGWVGGPIDKCVITAENRQCAKVAVPKKGTIMSYCDKAGAGIDMKFHPFPIKLIRETLDTKTCLSVIKKP